MALPLLTVRELRHLGYPVATAWKRVSQELLPPPISLGGKVRRFLEYEINIVNAAHAAGKTEEEIRDIVRRLVVAREEIYEILVSGKPSVDTNELIKSLVSAQQAPSEHPRLTGSIKTKSLKGFRVVE